MRRADDYDGAVCTTDKIGLPCTIMDDNYGNWKLMLQSFLMRVTVIYARLLAMESSLTTQLAALVLTTWSNASDLVVNAVMISHNEMVA